MPQSTKSAKSAKDLNWKAPKGFKLSFHKWSRRFYKTHQGKRIYFGRLDEDGNGWKEAQEDYEQWHRDEMLSRIDAQQAEIKGLPMPEPKGDDIRLGRLVNEFMARKEAALADGELTQRSWNDYHRTCERVLIAFGKSQPVDRLGPDHFERLRQDIFSTRKTVSSRKTEMTRVNVLFRFAADQHGIMVHRGQGFKPPSSRTARREQDDRERNGETKLFTAEEIHALLSRANDQMRCMIMLGINAAYDPASVADLERTSLQGEWLNQSRYKTGKPRRCWLWPETRAAIDVWMRQRSEMRSIEADHLVFITKYGNGWRGQGSATPICREFKNLLEETGLYKRGRGFRSLRYTFQTESDGIEKPITARAIMGHAEHAMSDTYRKALPPDENIQAVCEYVRQWWLKGKPEQAENRPTQDEANSESSSEEA